MMAWTHHHRAPNCCICTVSFSDRLPFPMQPPRCLSACHQLHIPSIHHKTLFLYNNTIWSHFLCLSHWQSFHPDLLAANIGLLLPSKAAHQLPWLPSVCVRLKEEKGEKHHVSKIKARFHASFLALCLLFHHLCILLLLANPPNPSTKFPRRRISAVTERWTRHFL